MKVIAWPEKKIKILTRKIAIRLKYCDLIPAVAIELIIIMGNYMYLEIKTLYRYLHA